MRWLGWWRRESETARILRKARALIADPARWGQNFGYGANSYGQTCALSRASRFCAVGAIGAACGLGYVHQHSRNDELAYARFVEADTALRAASERLFSRGAIDTNDSLGHAAVLAMYDAAIEAA